MFKTLLSLASSFFTGGVSSFFPWIVGGGALIGVLAYVYSFGYSTAEHKCNAAIYQAQVVALQAEVANQQKQLADTQSALIATQAEKQKVVMKVIQAKEVVNNNVKENVNCNIGNDLISVLNAERATTGNHK